MNTQPATQAHEDDGSCLRLAGAGPVALAVEELKRKGATVLRGIFDEAVIAGARATILANRPLFRRTRPTPSSGHLPAFHRYPQFEPLHHLLTGCPAIQEVVAAAVDGEELRGIGLSDITINRSQPWHVDLLRGKFRHHLDGADIWGPDGGGLYKILLYLNDSSSLRIIAGSHLRPIPLDSDRHAEPQGDDEVMAIRTRAGDVVVMDLRCSHRGADEAAYAMGQCDDDPRILVSTVLGASDHALTRAMEVGNFARYLDWIERNP